jgi:branched-chain amino acid transport system substrate-binding protein
VLINPALQELNWDPPRYMGTAFQNAWLHDVMWQAIRGWTGLDQYDEANRVGQQFLDDYQSAFGRRPEYCVPVVNRDIATVVLNALADAHPLTPRGVMEALERVKMLPAAAGSPGTRLSFGKWTRRGWMGAGYLVARQLEPEFGKSRLVGRFDD